MADQTKQLILVTGATGKQGSAVVRKLREHGFPVRAMTRNPDKPAARSLADEGAELAVADFNDAASLRRAMQGAYGVFAMSTFFEKGIDGEIAQGTVLADAARSENVTHYVFTSVAAADEKTGIPHFDSKYVIEEHVRGLGFPNFSFLRPVFFMENWLGMREMLQGGAIYWPLSPERRLQQVATDDIGAFAAMAFQNRDRWNGRAQVLAGDEASMTDVASAFSRRLSRPVNYQQIPWDQFEARMGHEMTVMFRWFEDHGYTAPIEALRREYSGLTSFDQWLARTQW